MSCSGSQTSARPPPKPNVLNPIDSRATLPVRIIRSAHEIFLPYFCLIGHSSLPALSHTSRLLETSQWNPRLSYHTRCSTMESDSSNPYFPFGAWPRQSRITATTGFSVIVPIDSAFIAPASHTNLPLRILEIGMPLVCLSALLYKFVTR